MNALLLCLIVIVIPTIQVFGNPNPPKNETLASFHFKDPMKQQMATLVGDLVLVVNTLCQARKVDVKAAVKTISDVMKIHLDIMTNNLTSYHQYQPTIFDDVLSYKFKNINSLTPPPPPPPPPTVSKVELPQKLEADFDFILNGPKLEEAIATFLNNLKNNTFYFDRTPKVASNDSSIENPKIE